MNAVSFKEHGGANKLHFGELPTPKPGAGEVQVRLHAASVNRLDLWVREGWPGLQLSLPHIPGADGAGEISAVGPDVDLAVGTRVVINPSLSCGACERCLAGEDNLCRSWNLLGETVSGTYAEYVVVPVRNVLEIPQRFPYITAAAAALVFHTAWHSLITRGGLLPGETVLIVGASGGVNTACIQVARYSGAQVIVVGSSDVKLGLAESLGAAVLINRSSDAKWAKAVYQATGKRGADIVVDNVGAATMMQSLRAARKGGRVLTVGNTSGATFEIDNRFLFGKHLALIGSSMGTHDDFQRVMSLVLNKSLEPALDRTFPLSEAAQAQERLARGEQMGKITLAI